MDDETDITEAPPVDLNDKGRAAFAEWLKDKPPHIAALANEFPPGSRFNVDGEIWWLIGYTDDDEIVLTPLVPGSDYEAATKAKYTICAEHIRRRRTQQ